MLKCQIFKTPFDHLPYWIKTLCVTVVLSRVFVLTLFLYIYLGFLSRTFMIHRTAGEEKGISLTSLYQFQPLHRHLEISWAITAEGSSLDISRSQNRSFRFRAQVTNY